MWYYSAIMWVYVQRTGNLYAVGLGFQSLLAGGYSGFGDDPNDPEAQCVADLGPIPCGKWSIGELIDNVTQTGVVLVSSMRLTPSSETDVCGRSGFLIHGDNSAGLASSGCIIITNQSSRAQIGTSGDKVLRVIAEQSDLGPPSGS